MSKTSTRTAARYSTDDPGGPGAAWMLHILTSPDKAIHGVAFPVSVGTTLCGRSPSGKPDARLLKFADSAMSRTHLSLVVGAGARELAVSDLESRNGTWLDGQGITGRRLVGHGSVIRMGGTVGVLEDGAAQFHAFDRPLRGMPGLALEARRMRSEMAEAAQTPLPTLVVGPAGTGKERASTEIAALSRRTGRVIRADIGAIGPGAMLSELFGHERNAFATAFEAKSGRLRDADLGTLVLDDVAEMTPHVQEKLLQWLQTGRMRPLGGTVDVIVKVKIIACTSANLDGRVAAGKFLPELAAKLQANQVGLVPLARRAADLLVLADASASPPGVASWSLALAPQVVETLALYNWPGNLIELARLLQMLRIVTPPVPMDALPPDLVETVRSRVMPRSPAIAADTGDTTAPTPRATELRSLLARFGGDIDAAAKALGRDRKHIDAWLAIAGISADELKPGKDAAAR